MSRVVVEMSAEDAKLHAAISRAVADHAKHESGIGKVAEASRRAAKEEEQLAREAKKVYEGTRTPMEQHQARLQRLAEMVQKGKIDQETYGRAASESYSKMDAALQKTRDSAQQTGEKLDQAGKSGIAAFGPQALSMVKTLAGALGVGAGLAGAVSLVRKEFEAVIAAQDRAKQATLTTAQAEINALRNLGAATPEERDAFLSDVRKVSAETGVSEKDLFLRSSEAMSAKGNLPASAVMEAVKQSAVIAPDSADEGKALAGAALDIGKITGATPKEVIGFMLRIGEQAHVTSTGKIAENLAPAMNAAIAAGASPQVGGAAWAALTQGINDTEGRIASTASIGLATQLRDLLPAEGEKYSEAEFQRDREALAARRKTDETRLRRAAVEDPEYKKRLRELAIEKETLKPGRRKLTPEESADREMRLRELSERGRVALEESEARAADLPEFRGMQARYALDEQKLSERREAAKKIVASGFTTMDERIAFLQQNPQARAEFLAKATFEKKAQIPIEQLLSGTGATGEAFSQFREALPAVKEGAATFDQYVSVIRGTPRQQTAQYGRELASARERIESSPENQLAAQIAITMEHFKPVLEDVGEWSTVAKLKSAGARLSPDLIGSVKGRLETKRQQLINPIAYTGSGSISFGPGYGGIGTPVSREPSPLEKRNADELGALVAAIDRLQKGQEEAARAQKEAAQKISAAADKFQQSNKSRPTLAPIKQRN